jgi:uncharacterized protein (TIGR03437 family)
VNSGAPATVGETITVWATGLGAGANSAVVPGLIKTGYPATAPIPIALAYGELIFSYYALPSPTAAVGSYVPVDQLISPVWVGLTPGYVGLYQINATVPPILAAATPLQSGTYGASITTPEQSSTIYIFVRP